MRILVLTFVLSFALSCRTNKSATSYVETSRFEIEEHSFNGKRYVDTTYFENGNIEAISTYAISKSGVKSEMLAGERKEFYDDGTLKSIGSYDMSFYTNCCFAGYCLIEYYYKTGEWAYYHPNAQLKVNGTYMNELEHIDTSCKGGDRVMTNRTTGDWSFYDNQGTKIGPTEQLLEQLEGNDSFF